MEIMFQAHHAPLSDTMRRRAERAVRKVARRLDRAVDAVVRFEQDGPTRRVEIVLHAAGHRRLVAEGRARYYGVALKDAADRLLARTTHAKRTRKERGRSLARV